MSTVFQSRAALVRRQVLASRPYLRGRGVACSGVATALAHNRSNDRFVYQQASMRMQPLPRSSRKPWILTSRTIRLSCSLKVPRYAQRVCHPMPSCAGIQADHHWCWCLQDFPQCGFSDTVVKVCSSPWSSEQLRRQDVHLAWSEPVTDSVYLYTLVF